MSRAAADIRAWLWSRLANLLRDTALRCEFHAASQFDIEEWPVLRQRDMDHWPASCHGARLPRLERLGPGQPMDRGGLFQPGWNSPIQNDTDAPEIVAPDWKMR